MICAKCKKDYPSNIIFKLTDKHSTHCFCPDCSVILIANKALALENDIDLNCEVTNEPGAVVFASGNECYILEKDIMLRLLSYNLKPEEYKILSSKKTGFNYMIHDDFYSEDGVALQPIFTA